MRRQLCLTALLCLILGAPTSFSMPQQGAGGAGSSRSSPGDGARGRGSAQPSTRAVSGQVISDGGRQLQHPVAVHLESSLGQIFDTVFTDGNGNFVFDQLSGGEQFYIVIDEPGFRRSRTRVPPRPFAMSREVIILESVDTAEAPLDGSGPIDLGLLTADIPEDAVEEFQRGARDMAEDNPVSAAEHLETAIEIAPGFYEAHNALGVAYERLGRRDDAVRHYEVAADLNPNAAPPVLSLGVIYLKDQETQNTEGQADEARASLEKALDYLEDAVERDPRSAYAQYYLGAAHYISGGLDSALDRLNRALSLNPQFHEVRLMLFNVYVAQGDDEAAVAQLTTYLEMFPDSPQKEAVERAKRQLEERIAGQ